MRDTLRNTFLALLFFAAGCSGYDRELMGDPEPEPQEPAAEQSLAPETEDSLGVGMFNELEYYGQWHHMEPYGWVFRPSVVSEWQPFINGHWIWTQYGWMWVDYDPWGWATSHYGYWTYDFAMGWVWIPDYTWSPVQVDWVMFDDYICWSPVPPPGTRFKEPWDADKAWVSVPVRRFKEQNIADYRVIPTVKSDSPMVYRGAPDIREIERHGPKFSMVEVQLDRRVVNEREFAKVRFTDEQRRIIDNSRPISIDATPVGGGPVYSPVAPSPTPSQPQTPTTTKSKSSGSKGSNDAEKRETRSYKDRKSDEKKDGNKDGGKSKNESSTTKKEKKGKQ
jgi:hypothetical protein